MYKAISSIGKVSVRQLVCWVGADAEGVHWNVMEDDGAQAEAAEETARLIADLLNRHAQEVDAPASADPFMPSPEVRAALRTVFYVNSQASYAEYGTALEVAEKWVRSWPQ